ncbi:hypothetical protein KCP78_25115 [Salmonella enterica subsp. enterica]|nr:hypothetical protein KCP78_25115 [Salmonella enterica subsp. enterica]
MTCQAFTVFTMRDVIGGVPAPLLWNAFLCGWWRFYKTVSPPCLHRRPNFRKAVFRPARRASSKLSPGQVPAGARCFYFGDGYAGTIARRQSLQRHRFLVRSDLYVSPWPMVLTFFASPLTTIALQVPVVLWS